MAFCRGFFSSSLGGFVVGYGSTDAFLVSSSTCKMVYSFLLERNYVVPHCITKYRPVFGEFYWPTTWRFLSVCPLDRKATDFAWKVAHGVPYTADRLLSFGLDIPSGCFCGHALESLSHLLFSCPLAQSGIAWIQSLLVGASPVAPIIYLRHIRFGFDPDELLCVPRVFVYLLHVMKVFVWWQRNDYRFCSTHPSAVGLIATLKASVKFYLPLYFKRFKSDRRRRFFHRQWGGNGVICQVRADKLVFNF